MTRPVNDSAYETFAVRAPSAGQEATPVPTTTIGWT